VRVCSEYSHNFEAGGQLSRGEGQAGDHVGADAGGGI
jgi:hypothetical protein